MRNLKVFQIQNNLWLPKTDDSHSDPYPNPRLYPFPKNIQNQWENLRLEASTLKKKYYLFLIKTDWKQKVNFFFLKHGLLIIRQIMIKLNKTLKIWIKLWLYRKRNIKFFLCSLNCHCLEYVAKKQGNSNNTNGESALLVDWS